MTIQIQFCICNKIQVISPQDFINKNIKSLCWAQKLVQITFVNNKSRTQQRLALKVSPPKWFLVQSTILMHPKPLAPTEFQPLSFRCVLQRFLLFLLSYTINAWPNLIFLPVGNLHRLCQFLKMTERDLIQVSIVLLAFFLLLVRSLSLLLMIA